METTPVIQNEQDKKQEAAESTMWGLSGLQHRSPPNSQQGMYL